MAPQDGPHEQDPVQELLHQLQPKLQRLFQRFRLPMEVAEKMLEDCLLVMTFRYEQLAQPEQWLLRTLRYRCARYWQDQRQQFLNQANEQLLGWLRAPGVSDLERRSRRQELSAVIDTMPRRCRLQLRDYYSLPIPEDELRMGRGLQGALQAAEGMTPSRCLTALMRRLMAASAEEPVPAGDSLPPS